MNKTLIPYLSPCVSARLSKHGSRIDRQAGISDFDLGCLLYDWLATSALIFIFLFFRIHAGRFICVVSAPLLTGILYRGHERILKPLPPSCKWKGCVVLQGWNADRHTRRMNGIHVITITETHTYSKNADVQRGNAGMLIWGLHCKKNRKIKKYIYILVWEKHGPQILHRWCKINRFSPKQALTDEWTCQMTINISIYCRYINILDAFTVGVCVRSAAAVILQHLNDSNDTSEPPKSSKHRRMSLCLHHWMLHEMIEMKPCTVTPDHVTWCHIRPPVCQCRQTDRQRVPVWRALGWHWEGHSS